MPSPDAIRFWYDHLGRYLHPESDDPINGPRLALSRTHDHSSRPGASLRLGSGKAACLVTSEGAILMADILPSKPLPASVAIMQATWRTVPSWTADIVTSPPAGDHFFAIFGKSPNVLDTFRISTADTLCICGAEFQTIQRAPVLAGIATLSGVPSSLWREAVALLDRRDRDPGGAAGYDLKLAALEKKRAGLRDLVDTLPARDTPEFNMLSMTIAVREKAQKGANNEPPPLD